MLFILLNLSVNVPLNFLFQHRRRRSTCHLFVEFCVTLIMCAYLPAFQHNYEDLCFIVPSVGHFRIPASVKQIKQSVHINEILLVILKFYFIGIQCLLMWNYLNIKDQSQRYKRKNVWESGDSQFDVTGVLPGEDLKWLDINLIQSPSNTLWMVQQSYAYVENNEVAMSQWI